MTQQTYVEHDCTYKLVDSAPHDWRVSAVAPLDVCAARHWYGGDEWTFTYEVDARAKVEALSAAGYTCIHASPPQCSEVVWDRWGYVPRSRP